MSGSILIRVITSFSLMGPITLMGGVSLKNGNFFIGYTDHVVSGFGYNTLQIDRTYNSQSTGTTQFGNGWSFNYAHRLRFYPDGYISIQEHGLGAVTLFGPALDNKEAVITMIDDLTNLAIEYEDLENNPISIVNYKNSLRQSIQKRHQKWDDYVSKGYIRGEVIFSEGMHWLSFGGNYQLLQGEGPHIVRTFRDGHREFYDMDGKLIKTEDNYQRQVSFFYDDNGFLTEIRDDAGAWMTFELEENGLIVKVLSPDGESNYRYDTANNLIRSEDADGNLYQHEYDRNYNMTAIKYTDGSKLEIEYYTTKNYVKSITERNGARVDYDYRTFYRPDGTIDDFHYATRVIQTDPSGQTHDNFYEYVIGTRAGGELYNRKIIIVENGIRNETTYHEICDSPVMIVQGNDSTFFTYNAKCALTSKRSNHGVDTELEYDPEINKPVRIVRGGETTWFSYDGKGNLLEARSDGGLWVKLHYNDEGKIRLMEQEEKSIFFEYNTMGKPVNIRVEDLGEILVEYDNEGNIKSVDSKEGSDVALQITSSFQKLLQIIAPAGVSLGM